MKNVCHHDSCNHQRDFDPDSDDGYSRDTPNQHSSTFREPFCRRSGKTPHQVLEGVSRIWFSEDSFPAFGYQGCLILLALCMEVRGAWSCSIARLQNSMGAWYENLFSFQITDRSIHSKLHAAIVICQREFRLQQGKIVILSELSIFRNTLMNVIKPKAFS